MTTRQPRREDRVFRALKCWREVREQRQPAIDGLGHIELQRHLGGSSGNGLERTDRAGAIGGPQLH